MVFQRCSIVALAAVAATFLWQALTIHYNYGGNWTALFFTGDRGRVPPALAAHTFIIRNSTGYDGPLYRYIAHDPLLRKGYDRYLDAPRLRYRRILVPALAWALAFGVQGAIDATYIGLILVSVFLGVFWCAKYFQLCEAPPYLGLLFLLVPATLTSVDRMLLDGTLAALAAGYFLADLGGNRKARWSIAALAGLVKETGLAFVFAAVIADLWRRQYRRAAVSATSAIPALAWFGYVAARARSRAEPFDILRVPFLGIIQRIVTLRSLPDPLLQSAFRVVDLIAILGYAVTLWLAWRWIRKDGPSATTIAVACFLALAAALGAPSHMQDAYGYARPVSPLLLYVMLRAAASRRWWQLAAPLAVTVSILIYFVKPLAGIIHGILS
jgi:hypothetical protein